MSDFKEKSLGGLKWSFIDASIGQGITVVFGLALARIISPRDFGLVGMLSIFIAVSQSLTDSGFTSALIRKTDCSERDYSTVFFYNLLVAIALCLLLFFSAPAIATFYGEPQLDPILKVLSLVLVAEASMSIQRTIFTKRIDFKTQTKVSVSSSLVSGIIALVMALLGYGVWSLVALSLSKSVIQSLMYWLVSNWRPVAVFSKSSFRELFGFGNKIMLAGLLNTAYQNLYLVVIGKYFTATELGYYSKASELRDLPSKNVMDVVNRVSYPTLSEVQHDTLGFRAHVGQYMRSTMFVSQVMMLALAAISPALVEVLLGPKWNTAAEYLQLLCIVGILYPLHSININILKVKGRSDLVLKLNIWKKILNIPVLILGVLLGIKVMIALMFVSSIIAFFMHSYFANLLIEYGWRAQIKDILPSFGFALLCSTPAWVIGFVPFGPGIILLLQLVLLIAAFFFIGTWSRNREYIYLKSQLPYLTNRK